MAVSKARTVDTGDGIAGCQLTSSRETLSVSVKRITRRAPNFELSVVNIVEYSRGAVRRIFGFGPSIIHLYVASADRVAPTGSEVERSGANGWRQLRAVTLSRERDLVYVCASVCVRVYVCVCVVRARARVRKALSLFLSRPLASRHNSPPINKRLAYARWPAGYESFESS